jgi:alpha-1,2-mannosyltransferase
VAGAIGGLLVFTHLLGRLWWHDVVFALNGWYVPYDFAVFLHAGDEVLSGRSPYVDPSAYAGATYIYPPPLAVLITPLSALPEQYAATVWTLLGIGAVICALLLLGVRDRRCIAIALFFPYTIEVIKYGELGSFLVLLVALLWRFRDGAVAAGASAGGAVALKLFLWPLVPWLAFTRRWRATAYAVVAALGLAVGAWAVIAFRGFTDYPELLRRFDELESAASYSAVAVLQALGLSSPASRVLTVAVGAALLVLALRAARAPAADEGERDRRSLILVLAAALVLTPVLWQHSLVLLVVPIALMRPRLSPLWLLPLAAWPFYGMDWYDDWPEGDLAPLLSTAVFVALVFALALLRPRPAQETVEA